MVNLSAREKSAIIRLYKPITTILAWYIQTDCPNMDNYYPPFEVCRHNLLSCSPPTNCYCSMRPAAIVLTV